MAGGGLIGAGGDDGAHGGVEALAGHGVVDVAGVHGDQGHLALCQRARLVGADDGRRAQRLHRGELAHEHVLLDHLGAAGGQGNGDAQGQPLGDRGDGEGDGDEDHEQPGRGVGVLRVFGLERDANREDADAHGDGHVPDLQGECLEVVLQGGIARLGVGQAALPLLLLLLGLRCNAVLVGRVALGSLFLVLFACAVEERGDGADTGAHPRGDDDADRGAGLDVTAREGHVVGGELLGGARHARLHLGALGHVLGLPCKQHFVHAKVVCLEHAHVGGDDIASAELDDIAADEIFGVDLHLLPVANGVGGWGLQRRQRVECVVGVVLCHRGDGGVDEHDDGDGDGVDVRQELVLVVAGGADRGRRQHGAHHQVHDDAVELDEK
mmetsp:Transcript_12110/g.29322  ORF Transcript_12110/g.29322 Transcript_12110/m.29322 type:complete len:382 (+) Transcript_12110:2373-3518(+)